MPWFEYDVQVLGWPGGCEGESLIVMGFDWMTWLQTPHGVALSFAPAAIAGASSTDLARLVTAIVRGDRFVEGNLAGAIAVRRRHSHLSPGGGPPRARPCRAGLSGAPFSGAPY